MEASRYPDLTTFCLVFYFARELPQTGLDDNRYRAYAPQLQTYFEDPAARSGYSLNTRACRKAETSYPGQGE